MENSIRYLRFAHGQMTQAELARRVGVTRQTVVAIELGHNDPTLATALRIAAVFSACVDDVFHLPEADPCPKVAETWTGPPVPLDSGRA